jgi:magnesium chelatase subunit D
MKEALLAVGASDDLDGVLLRGEKGTAKSTAVRALAALLPPQRAIADCRYGCPPGDSTRQCADCRERSDPPVEQRAVPFVTLPLGATRERVVGSLSVAEALSGEPEFEPGLLARANRGFLYVDEVNLLDDHLVDVLLDAAAAGVNRVERDGVSVTHPASFTLIGTMNPEEGDLRPQLRDRFALQASVTGCEDVGQRTTIVERALARDSDQSTAGETIPEETDRARQRLSDARKRLPEVALPEAFVREIAELCLDAGVDGHRADIATARTARAIAALDSRPKVIEPDVRRAAALTLPHRLQSTPFEDAPDADTVIDDHFEESTDESDAETEPASNAERDESGQAGDSEAGEGGQASDGTGGESGQASNSESNQTAGNGDGKPRDGEGERGRGGDTNTAGRGATDLTAGDGDGRPTADNESESSPGDTRNSGVTDRDQTAASGTEDGSGRTGSESGQSTQNGTGGDSGAGNDSTEADDRDRPAGETPVVPGEKRAGVATATAPEFDLSESTADSDDASSAGRSTASPAVGNRGGRVRTERAAGGESVDAAASVRAAAARGGEQVESQDLRKSVRAGEAGALVVFAVDASASMRGPLRAAKGVALELLRDAYQQRDEVALVTFAGEDAQVVLPPTDSVGHAARHLKKLPSGDRTPLPAGIETAGDVLARADPAVGVVVLVTDGRANAVVNDHASAGPTAATRTAARKLAQQDAHVVVVDAGDDGRSLTGEITTITDGERVPLSALSADHVAGAVARARDQE